MICEACPRKCGAKRIEGQPKTYGYCKAPMQPVLARAALHFWEEPCISGETGSGTVFFSGCNLQCVYCQNKRIASGEKGRPVTVERLSEIFLELQEKGANNINLVTPSHYYAQIRQALQMVKGKLRIPILSNTSSYEAEEELKKMEGFIDIYLADYKYASSVLAKKYSNAPDYPKIAIRAIDEMLRQTGEPVFSEDGLLKRGVIIRHLLLPGYVEESKEAIRLLYERYQDKVYLSIMNQYTPMPGMEKYPEINRRVSKTEYDELVDYAIELGVENGFIQEGETAEESFIPEFDGEGIE